jgi:hypothetical protein
MHGSAAPPEGSTLARHGHSGHSEVTPVFRIHLEVEQGASGILAWQGEKALFRRSAIKGHGWPAGDTRNLLQFFELEVVARDGIEPSTRGISVRRRAHVGASKPTTRDNFPRSRPVSG